MLIVVIVLIICNIASLIALYTLKNQIKQIIFQIRQINRGKLNIISIPLINDEIVQLSSEVNNLFEDKNNLKNELIKNEEELKESIANISHDFRTPLTSILGYIQLVEKGCLNKKERENLQVVKSKAFYLKNLIDEFFELSILDSNNAEPENEKINITNFLSDIIIENVQLIENSGIEINVDIPNKAYFIYSDKGMLKRVVENLISNSVRYSAGIIYVKLIDNKDWITIVIGNSIEEESIDTEKIFYRFYKGDRSRNSKGTGLGLAVAKLLCDKIGGNISADSKEHKMNVYVSIKKN